MNKIFNSVVGLVLLSGLSASVSHASLSRPSDTIQLVDTENKANTEILKVNHISLVPSRLALIFKGPKLSLALGFSTGEAALAFKTQLEATHSYAIAVKLTDLKVLPGQVGELRMARANADQVLVIRVGEKSLCQMIFSALHL